MLKAMETRRRARRLKVPAAEDRRGVGRSLVAEVHGSPATKFSAVIFCQPTSAQRRRALRGQGRFARRGRRAHLLVSPAGYEEGTGSFTPIFRSVTPTRLPACPRRSRCPRGPVRKEIGCPTTSASRRLSSGSSDAPANTWKTSTKNRQGHQRKQAMLTPAGWQWRGRLGSCATLPVRRAG